MIKLQAMVRHQKAALVPNAALQLTPQRAASLRISKEALITNMHLFFVFVFAKTRNKL